MQILSFLWFLNPDSCAIFPTFFVSPQIIFKFTNGRVQRSKMNNLVAFSTVFPYSTASTVLSYSTVLPIHYFALNNVLERNKDVAVEHRNVSRAVTSRCGYVAWNEG